MLRLRLVLATTLFPFLFFAQSQPKSFTVKFTNEPILVDGILDETVWKTAESANNFQQYFPSDSTLAAQQTDIKMLYNATTLFIGIKLNTEGDNYVIPSLERDYRAGGNDPMAYVERP